MKTFKIMIIPLVPPKYYLTIGGFNGEPGEPRPQAPHFWQPEGAPHLVKQLKIEKKIFGFQAEEINKKERNQHFSISN